MYLLEHPEKVAEDGFLAMAAGIWFYMTPQDPKPSMHDVMTGFFVPNAKDKAANFGATFGTTINIINGGYECGNGSSKSVSRGQYYTKWLEFFGMPAEPSGIGCANQRSSFPVGGTGDTPGYWTKVWDGTAKC